MSVGSVNVYKILQQIGYNGMEDLLHKVCCLFVHLQVSCAVVSLLLEHGANPDILCEGHSALSLAICSGNDMVGYH